MMEENLPIIKDRKQLHAIPKSDYVLIKKKFGCKNHRIHKSDCGNIDPKSSYTTNESDVKKYVGRPYPPKNSVHYHVMHDDKLILKRYMHCKNCFK